MITVLAIGILGSQRQVANFECLITNPSTVIRQENYEKFFGKNWIDFVQRAERASVVTIRNQKIIGETAVPNAWLRQMRTVFFQEVNHEWKRANFCAFEPMVGVRFYRSGDFVTLLFCFSCDDLMFVFEKTAVHSPKHWIKPGRATFLSLFKKALPRDKVIQALPLMGQ